MLGLRGKLLIGLGTLLMCLVAVAVLSNVILNRYSDSIQKLFVLNYDSAAASQTMKESVEQLTDLAERRAFGNPLVHPTDAEPQIARFEQALAVQSQISDIPGEREATDHLADAWREYLDAYRSFMAQPHPSLPAVGPLLDQGKVVRDRAQEIVDMNLSAMTSGRGQARAAAARATRAMHGLAVVGGVVALILVALCTTIVLRPLQALTRSAGEIASGNLDLAVSIDATDEIGQLARAFNHMASQLRHFKRLDRERLARTQHTLRLAIDSLPDAVLVLDPAGTVEVANQTASRLFALYPGKEIAQSHLSALAQIPANHTDASSGYRAAIKLDDDGATRYFLPRASPIVDEQLRSIGTALVLSDVTDLRRFDQMKNDLLSMVSHELKNPLTSVRLIMHLLVDRPIGPLTEEQHELLTAARDDTDRLGRIIENLLDMGRIEAGKALMDVHPIPADQLLRQCVAPMRASFDEHDVTLRTDLPLDSAPLVAADATRMSHVFSNLLRNALRFTAAGGSVTCSVAAEANEVRFSVTDTGAGIPPQYLGRVFDKFFRAPGQPGDTGSGLGLAIVKDIVEAHGGRIFVESTEGHGTTFTFTLPVARAAPGTAPPRLPANEPRAASSERVAP